MPSDRYHQASGRSYRKGWKPDNSRHHTGGLVAGCKRLRFLLFLLPVIAGGIVGFYVIGFVIFGFRVHTSF